MPLSTVKRICKNKSLREKTHLSQAVFAAVLNTSVSSVQKCEIGDKKPSGPSLKLLNLIERKGLKYRLYYGQSGRCLIRYDNEWGKGDHRHYGDAEGHEREEDYVWVSVQQLIADFEADIERLRGKQHD